MNLGWTGNIKLLLLLCIISFAHVLSDKTSDPSSNTSPEANKIKTDATTESNDEKNDDKSDEASESAKESQENISDSDKKLTNKNKRSPKGNKTANRRKHQSSNKSVVIHERKKNKKHSKGKANSPKRKISKNANKIRFKQNDSDQDYDEEDNATVEDNDDTTTSDKNEKTDLRNTTVPAANILRNEQGNATSNDGAPQKNLNKWGLDKHNSNLEQNRINYNRQNQGNNEGTQPSGAIKLPDQKGANNELKIIQNRLGNSKETDSDGFGSDEEGDQQIIKIINKKKRRSRKKRLRNRIEDASMDSSRTGERLMF